MRKWLNVLFCNNNNAGHQKHNKSQATICWNTNTVHKCPSAADDISYQLPDFYLTYKIPCGRSGIVQAWRTEHKHYAGSWESPWNVCISIACYVWVGRAGQSKHEGFWHGKQTHSKQTFQIANVPLVSTKVLINIYQKIYLHKCCKHFSLKVPWLIQSEFRVRIISFHWIWWWKHQNNKTQHVYFIEKAIPDKNKKGKDLLPVDWEEYYEYQITFNGIISNHFKQQVEPWALKGQISWQTHMQTPAQTSTETLHAQRWYFKVSQLSTSLTITALSNLSVIPEHCNA